MWRWQVLKTLTFKSYTALKKNFILLYTYTLAAVFQLIPFTFHSNVFYAFGNIQNGFTSVPFCMYNHSLSARTEKVTSNMRTVSYGNTHELLFGSVQCDFVNAIKINAT